MPATQDPNRPAEIETNPSPQGDGRYPRELGDDGLPVRNPPGQAREDRREDEPPPRSGGRASG